LTGNYKLNTIVAENDYKDMKRINVSKLIETKLMSKKFLVFLLFFLSIIFIGYLIAFISTRYFLNTGQIRILILLSAIILFQLTKFYNEMTRTYFYLNFLDKKIIFPNFKKEIQHILEMKIFSSLITNTLKNAFKTENIVILVKNFRKEKFNIKKISGYRKKEIKKLLNKELFFSVMPKIKKPFIVQEISKSLNKYKNREELISLKNKLKELKIEVVTPLFFKDKLIGIILIGQKKSSEAFTKGDMELLTTFSKQASIALRNTLLYGEVKKRKKELERFYRMTVDKEIMILELKKRILGLEEKLKEKKNF